MTENFQLEEAYRILTKFESADEIADYFRALGIKAQPLSAQHCAVSQYMKQNGAFRASTGPCDGEYWSNSWSDTKNRFRVESHTLAVRHFINHFDKGAYPDLITSD